MSHSINKAVTLHFLISDAIRNNHLYQRFLTVQEANLSGLSHVFPGNSLEAQVVSVSPPPVQLSSLEPQPTSDLEADHCLFLTSRMVTEWHSFTLTTLSSYKLQQASHSTSPPTEKLFSIYEFHSAFSLYTLYFGKQCSSWHSLTV